MSEHPELDAWCKSQERFLRGHLNCLRQGRIRVHAVENNRFIDTTDDVVAGFVKQLAELRACLGEKR